MSERLSEDWDAAYKDSLVEAIDKMFEIDAYAVTHYGFTAIFTENHIGRNWILEWEHHGEQVKLYAPFSLTPGARERDVRLHNGEVSKHGWEIWRRPGAGTWDRHPLEQE